MAAAGRLFEQFNCQSFTDAVMLHGRLQRRVPVALVGFYQMNNATAILRTLIIYAICVPVAIVVGVLLTEPMYASSWLNYGLLAALLCLPILLRWHHPLLVFCWNMPLTVFFLPGQPTVWLPMMAASLGISVLQRTMNRDMRFLPTPRLFWPLICLLVVTLFTARMTGGIGLHSFGSDVSGGKRYIFLITGILGFFALKAQRIPPERAWLYLGLFFLSSCFSVIGDLVSFIPRQFDFIFMFFSPNYYAFSSAGVEGVSRFSGLQSAASGVFFLMMARYGIRGIFMSGRLLRIVMLISFMALGLLGGFRILLITFALVFTIQFFLEGLHRTKLLPMFIFAGIFGFALLFLLADKLPFAVQRSMSILPVHISAAAKADAEASTAWRIAIWKAVLPQVPKHLLLGRGYGLTDDDFTAMTIGSRSTDFAADWGAAIASDYHNGPLSVILPFGIWGVVAFLWLLIAGGSSLYDNFRYGDPSLRTANALLLAAFLTRTILFLFVAGSLYSDIMAFCGYFGMSVSLNGGICRRSAPAAALQPEKADNPALARPRLQPA